MSFYGFLILADFIPFVIFWKKSPTQKASITMIFTIFFNNSNGVLLGMDQQKCNNYFSLHYHFFFFIVLSDEPEQF